MTTHIAPPTESESNHGMTRDNLLCIIELPKENVARVKGENHAEEETPRHEAQMRTTLPEKNGIPIFDIVLLGAGDDGHTSSIFPGQERSLNARRFIPTRQRLDRYNHLMVRDSKNYGSLIILKKGSPNT